MTETEQAREDVGKLLEGTVALIRKIEHKGGSWIRIESALRRAHTELTSSFLGLYTLIMEEKNGVFQGRLP